MGSGSLSHRKQAGDGGSPPQIDVNPAVVVLSTHADLEAIGGRWRDERGALWLSARVRAVPEKGRANAALIALLAQALDWPVRAILLESGDSNRLKRLRIIGGGDALERLTARIEQWMEMT